MRNRLIDRYGLILLFCLLCGIEVYAADRDLWIRVERVDSLFHIGRMTEARAMAEELIPEVMQQEDILSEARLRLIIGVSMRSEGLEQDALEQMKKAAALVESSKYERLDSPVQRHFAAMLLATLAMSEQEMGQTEEGMRHARLSIGWAQRTDDKVLQAFIFPYMGHVLLRCGQAEEALPILQTGKRLAHQQGLAEYEKIAERDIVEVQAKVDEDSQTEELLADQVHDVVSDSVMAQTVDTIEKEVVVTVPGMRQETAWWRHRQVMLLGVLLTAIMLGLIGLYLFRQWHFKRKISQLKEDSETRYLEGKEEERNRLAKEMHDGVSNQLFAIEMKLQTDGVTPQTMQMLTESREQVRRVSHELMPPDFQYATLDEIMRNYVEALNGANGCELSYRSEPADADWGRIPTDKALGIYRIVQEAVGNALKHSEASHIAVVLQQQGNVVVTVADDGKKEMGEVNGASSNGIGLRTMHQRADAIGGRITMSNHGGIHLFTLEVEHEK